MRQLPTRNIHGNKKLIGVEKLDKIKGICRFFQDPPAARGHVSAIRDIGEPYQSPQTTIFTPKISLKTRPKTSPKTSPLSGSDGALIEL